MSSEQNKNDSLYLDTLYQIVDCRLRFQNIWLGYGYLKILAEIFR